MQNTVKILQHLGAFWQHFGIHKRKSDFSGKDLISVFSKNCPYPVWHRDEWIENSNPTFAIYDEKKDFWGQIWSLFSKCPIAHNIGIGNENCEYTDDCWYSKNIYLSHSILECEDIRYSYRIFQGRNSYFCTFSSNIDLCIDVIFGFNCHNVKYAIDVKRCHNSAFLFDCQDCEDCLLCWNLRNKKYCIANKEYSKEDYEKEIKKYDLNSLKVYNTLKEQFSNFIKTNAWWKNLRNENIETSIGDYLKNVQDCENCFYIQDSQNCKNTIRGGWMKSCEFCISAFKCENVLYSVLAQDNCYNIKYCSNVTKSKNLEYCINCYECENCFLCASLVGKKYYILNKEYSKEDYEKQKQIILEDMKKKTIYGDFFPAYFAPSSYDESLSGIYHPLNIENQKKQGLRVIEEIHGNKGDFQDITKLPDNLNNVSNINNTGFWDDIAKRPFQSLKEDIAFYKKIGVPINDKFYIRRIKENFSWMFPSFELRETICTKSGKKILTTLPKELDGRIIDEKEYEKVIY